MRQDEAIKFFGLNNLSIESDIRRIEKELKIDCGHSQKRPIDRDYYPQFAEQLREEAKRMSASYTIFYCLENSIREIIVQRLEEQNGPNWWDKSVPNTVRNNAEKNRKKELASGVTPSSAKMIDYTNFGELGEIIKTNWDIFGEIFSDIRAVESVLARLNTLRAPIAHCKDLAEDEEQRLHLSLRDWFRLME